MAGETGRMPLPISEVLKRAKLVMEGYDEQDALLLIRDIAIWGIEHPSPTLAELVTPEEASELIDHLGKIPIADGDEVPEKFMDALWQRAHHKPQDAKSQEAEG